MTLIESVFVIIFFAFFKVFFHVLMVVRGKHFFRSTIFTETGGDGRLNEM